MKNTICTALFTRPTSRLQTNDHKANVWHLPEAEHANNISTCITAQHTPHLPPTTHSITTQLWLQDKRESAADADKAARRKTMPKIPPVRSYNKFQSSRKSGVYSN